MDRDLLTDDRHESSSSGELQLGTSPGLRSYPAHAVVERWVDAIRLRDLPIEMVSFGDLESGPWGRLPVRLRNLLNPGRMVPRLARAATRSRLVLLRDFLTVPMAVWAPALQGYAHRIGLVLHHNLQRAATRRRDRAGLRYLARLGFRFVVPESAAGVSGLDLGVSETQVLVLPFGMSQRPTYRRREAAIATVVAADREEKRGSETLERVRCALAQIGGGVRLRVASRSEESLAAARTQGWEAVSTVDQEDWQSVLRESSAVVLDYPSESYWFRPSATVCDAIGAGAAVVIPDYPVFREQVQTPAVVGALFGDGRPLRDALAEALRLGTGAEAPFEAYRAFRSPEALASRLAGFLDHQDVPPKGLPAE